MAMRVRADGTMWCAAYTEPQEGDTYIDDALHHQMVAVHGVIVAYPMPRHEDEPQWFWRTTAPVDCDFTTGLSAPLDRDSEYAKLIERLRSNHTLDTPRNTLTGSLINPDGPAAANHIEDLLAEIASLRSERDEWKELAHLSGLRAKRVRGDGYPEDRESEGMTVCGECGGWGEHLMSCVRGGYKPENYR